MRKMFAIIGALISGGLGIAILGTGSTGPSVSSN